MSILTSFTGPLAAFTAFSRAGVSWRHGPHQVAQKSTITGTVLEASRTSATKLASEPSLMRSAAWAAAVSPISDMVSPGRRERRLRWSRSDARATKRSAGFQPASSEKRAGSPRYGREIDDERCHAHGRQEAPEAGLAHPRGRGVDEGMEVHEVGARQGGVENEADAMSRIIDQGE